MKMNNPMIADKTYKRSFKIGFKGKYDPTKLKERILGEDSPNQTANLVRWLCSPIQCINPVVDPWTKASMRTMENYVAPNKFVHLYLNAFQLLKKVINKRES